MDSEACIKIPQEMVELQFLGVQFMLLRLSLTVILVIIMAVLIEKIIEWGEGKVATMASDNSF